MPGPGADPAYRLPIRVVNEFAWHNLFARNMFIPETDRSQLPSHLPEFTVIDAPNFRADPARHGSRSDVFVFVHFGRKLVLIGGTHYAGEIKKSIFTVVELPAAASRASCRCTARPTSAPAATPRSSSASPAPARRRCRAIRSAA